MGVKTVHLAIYEPPKPGLPYLVAVIYSDGRVDAVQAQSELAAQRLHDELEQKIRLEQKN